LKGVIHTGLCGDPCGNLPSSGETFASVHTVSTIVVVSILTKLVSTLIDKGADADRGRSFGKSRTLLVSIARSLQLHRETRS
jgi:hypothetical protein